MFIFCAKKQIGDVSDSSGWRLIENFAIVLLDGDFLLPILIGKCFAKAALQWHSVRFRLPGRNDTVFQWTS